METEQVIDVINQELKPYTNRKKSKHASKCECYVCTSIFQNEFSVERFGKFSMEDGLFLFEENPVFMMLELVKRIKYFISQHLHGLNLHYRTKKHIWGIEYEFFRVYEF
ncbi:hypothetical protein LCGC14_2555380 [marine sediment metagenome]|uniref:Uncharacterized protein n=1 Tax=marine sediment metagenome TaxID=412755 RepID=A0A0F9DET0_9ZZZZ|nr:hypothetical protein [bacterium]